MQSFRQNHHQAELERAEVTIEFLRARLVSERSMCKAARERMLQLEEKIVQLERMLEGEIARRKKSELTMKELLLSLQYPVEAPPIKQQQRDYYAGKGHTSTNNNRDSGCNCKFRTIFSFPRSSNKASSSPSRNYQHSRSSKYDGERSSPLSTATSATYTTITSEGYNSAITYNSIKPGSTRRGSYNSSSNGNESSLQARHGNNNTNNMNRYSQEQEQPPIESWQQKFNQALIYEQQRQQQEQQQEEISMPPLETSPAEMINLQRKGQLNVERSDHRVQHQYTSTSSTAQQQEQAWGSSGELSDSIIPRRIGKSCRTFKRRSDISR